MSGHIIQDGFKSINRGYDSVFAELTDEFSDAFSKYYDNDIDQFSSPHHDALDLQGCETIVCVIEIL